MTEEQKTPKQEKTLGKGENKRKLSNLDKEQKTPKLVKAGKKRTRLGGHDDRLLLSMLDTIWPGYRANWELFQVLKKAFSIGPLGYARMRCGQSGKTEAELLSLSHCWKRLAAFRCAVEENATKSQRPSARDAQRWKHSVSSDPWTNNEDITTFVNLYLAEVESQKIRSENEAGMIALTSAICSNQKETKP